MVTNAGEIGIIKDIDGFELPANAFTDGQNVRFDNNYVEKFKGHSVAFTPSIAPYHLHPVQKTEVFFWIYAGLTSVYITDGTTHNNISNGTYTTTANKNWESDDFQGIPVLCNERQVPQILFPISATNTLIDLPNWPSNTTAKVVKSFGSYMVALNLDENGTNYSNVVRTSNQADPGTYPSSWDYTDPTNDATRAIVPDCEGELLNGGKLGNIFMVYAEGSTHTMQFIGGSFKFSRQTAFSSQGMFAKKCFTKFKDNGIDKHCVLTQDDLIIHDGRSSQSIVKGRYKDTLFDELAASTYPQRAFLTTNFKKDEVWVCYPTGSNTQCNKALVWNYLTNAIGFRDITASHIAFGVIDAAETATWANDTETWAQDTTFWNTREYDPSSRGMLMADATNIKLFKLNDTNQFNGSNFTSYVERTGLDILKGGKIDTRARTYTRTLYPRMSGSGTVTFYGGGADAPGGSTSYDSNDTFTIGTDYKVDLIFDSRLPAIKIESTGDVSWRFYGFLSDGDMSGEA